MNIGRIKNKYLRRSALVLFVPVATIIGMPLCALYATGKAVVEYFTELPGAVENCWKGRDL